MVMGLLSGAQGTYATQALRNDEALLKMLSLPAAPEEVTNWRMLKPLGELAPQESLDRVQAIAARRILEKISRPSLLLEGFVPLFPDGSLLEGSGRREGTKYIREKGTGLMWSTVFVGPVLCAQRMAGEGQGEQTCVRAMIEDVDRTILKPLKLHDQTLVLADSLHGDEPTLAQLEAAHLHYLVGANKLAKTEQTLAALPETSWEDTGARSNLGWIASGACVCWLQCKDWPAKRLLVGRRFMREGEMIWNYAGALTDLRDKDVRPMLERGLSFARAMWRLYDAKAGMETQFKDGLIDLGLHHPPCREYVRNAGFYAVGALAWLLGVAVDVLGGVSEERGNMRRKDGGQRTRPTPRRMRLWRLRRELFSLPGRVARHARELKVQLLGVGEGSRQLFERYWGNLSLC
jgi:hypothetical protein